MIKENIKKYCHHLSTCNIMQDWSEAEQAMADTPEAYRDESWYIAMDEIAAKRSICTCGLDELLNKPFSPAKSAKEFIKNIYGDNKADWESNQCDIRFNLSDIAQLCQEFAATQNNSFPSAEGAEEILLKHGFFVMTHKEGSEYVRKVFINPVVAAMQEFAALHAQRLAEKMVEEKLRGERYITLLDFQTWLNNEQLGNIPDLWVDEYNKYLKSRENGTKQ